MRTVESVLPRVASFFLVMLIMISVIYPAAIIVAANVAFGHEANGSVIVGKDGTKYGSTLPAQKFTGNQYPWDRVTNVDTGTSIDESGKSLAYVGASNKTPVSSELEAMIAERVKKIRVAHPGKREESIPIDLVTCSGNGLDPEISPAVAGYQAERIAREWNTTVEDIKIVINRYTTGRFLGILGEPKVNVLKVNLTLDGLI